MKKIFIFIFLLFSLIFFSSCHDEGLFGVVNKSDLPVKTIDPTIIDERKYQTSTRYRLEKMMRRNPGFKRIIEMLDRS